MKTLLTTALPVLLLAASATCAETQPARQLPGPGVADPAGKTGFFPGVDGGINAVDLSNGKLLWHSKEATKPLLATADRLFSEKGVTGKPNQIRIVVLDLTKEGKRVLESEPVSLPDWVSVQVAYGRSYRSSSRLDGNMLLVSWEARAFYAGGAAPAPGMEEAARKEASGVIRMEVATGKCELPGKDNKGDAVVIRDEINSVKIGDTTLSVEDGPAKNGRNPFQQQRSVQARNAAKAIVWQHAMAAPVFLMPLP